MTAVKRSSFGLTLAAGALVLLTACGSDTTVDSSEIPLVRPAALTAKDGTQIPMPPQVADTGTPSQRDRYAAQVLVPTKLSVHVPASAQACGLLNGGLSTKDTVSKIQAQERFTTREDAQRVVYAGTLAWCPKFRAPFDALAAEGAGGEKGSSSSSSTTPSSSSSSKAGSSSSSSASGSSGSSSKSSTSGSDDSG